MVPLSEPQVSLLVSKQFKKTVNHLHIHQCVCVCVCVCVLSWELNERFLHLSSDWNRACSAGGGANAASSANHTAQIHSTPSSSSSRTDVFIRTESIRIRTVLVSAHKHLLKSRAQSHSQPSREITHTHTRASYATHFPAVTHGPKQHRSSIRMKMCVCSADQRIDV